MKRFFSLSKGIQVPTMRFVQFLRKNDNRKRLGVVSEDGSKLSELSERSCVSHDMLTFLSQNYSTQELKNKVECVSTEPVTDEYTLLAPIANPGKIICVGLNYKCHCDEQNLKPPIEPIFFSKFTNTIVGPLGNIIAHKCSEQIDWEVELAVVIGKKGSRIPVERAYDHIFGYTTANDVSARDWQKKRNGKQWLMGKSMDTFCPIGPAIIHKSLIPDVNDLYLRSYVNGVEKQNGNTKDMIFKIDELICRVSQTITLLPGDILLTGTPKGVGVFRDPPEFLKPGDIVETEVQCIGRLRNTVVEPEPLEN